MNCSTSNASLTSSNADILDCLPCSSHHFSSPLTTTYSLENQSKCDRLTKYVDWFPSEPLSVYHGYYIDNDYKN